MPPYASEMEKKSKKKKKKIWNRMTASVLKQDPNTKKVQTNAAKLLLDTNIYFLIDKSTGTIRLNILLSTYMFA